MQNNRKENKKQSKGNILEKYIICVDFGGTKILSALLNNQNEIVGRFKVPTDASKGPDKLVTAIAQSVTELLNLNNLNAESIKAVCLGVPGTVNPYTGIVESAPNIGMKNYNIKEALQKYFSLPILIENDVNLAALGIKKFEFNNEVNNMLIVFVGTGIGGGLIFNGKVYRGSSFFAGEIGHILVNSKGRFSSKTDSRSFEQTASRTAVVDAIINDIKKGKKSVLSPLVNEGKKIKSKALLNAVKAEDKLVINHINNSCNVIGTVLGSIVTLLNFDTIVLGGGVIEAMNDYMIPRITKAFQNSVLEGPGKIVKVVETKLGDDAALYGGYGMVEEFLEN